jgi:predicted lipoprotein
MAKLNNKIKGLMYLCLAAIVLGLSIRLKPLDEIKGQSHKEFNAGEYALDFWNRSLPRILDTATDMEKLLALLESDKKAAINTHGKSIGIGAQYSFLVKGSGTIEHIASKGVLLSLAPFYKDTVMIRTRNFFSNAIRDASGVVNVSDFPSTMEFNEISGEINRIVQQQVIADHLDLFEPGNPLEFVGAFELDENTRKAALIEIIPIRLNRPLTEDR